MAPSKRSNKAAKGQQTPKQPPKPKGPAIVRDAVALSKLIEAIGETPGGKRSLSRLARTCKAFTEPALDVLWRELDSIVPIVGLFPGHLLKKTRRPGLGFSQAPKDEDWQTIINYSQRIRKITYDENASNVSPAIFPILDECRPMLYILPQLQELTWKVETHAALERCTIFLNPSLQSINLEVGAKLPKLNDFLADMSSRTKLKGFTFVSPTSLPDSFTELLIRQDALEKVVLVAPGALAPGIGRWVASLPELKHLQLDLTGRSPIAVEGFFDELRLRSGDATPSSVGSRDSGVFSGEEFDFTEIRKSALRLTGDLPPKGSFVSLKKISLTGEVANIAVFVKHLESDLVHLDLCIEDPPDKADWQDLCEMICDRFDTTLQSIRITATPSSKFADLVRSTSRAEPPTARLSLEKFAGLRKLLRFEVDLPESVVFYPNDIKALAKACPNVEIVRLCPLARFPLPHSPKITLEDLVPLISGCRRLNTLAVVCNAGGGSEKLLNSQHASSKSLLRLHFGHSWANDPLQISIFLSHLAPGLELLKFFQEKTRPGYIETHAKAWQTVSEILPHLQKVRESEKSFIELPLPELELPDTCDKGIDATPQTRSFGVSAQVQTEEEGIQFSPELVSCGVEAMIETCEMSIDATPQVQEIAIEAKPVTVSTAVSAMVQAEDPFHKATPTSLPPTVYIISSLLSFLTFAYRFTTFPFAYTSRLVQLLLGRSKIENRQTQETVEQPKSPVVGEFLVNGHGSTLEDDDSIPLETLPVRQ
ncbi:hypothetical protein CPB83DRAFT_855589 [Crepidotus variabilis]|uniref:Uncharacterized protein n=1 Tax=Crepidotus variabilis TaxID=179855 RepID=A0A9P6JNU4_9AGAR|nr:hypothetical protein CPB83DRAFT_855589 [Crepidotus variabilis]